MTLQATGQFPNLRWSDILKSEMATTDIMHKSLASQHGQVAHACSLTRNQSWFSSSTVRKVLKPSMVSLGARLSHCWRFPCGAKQNGFPIFVLNRIRIYLCPTTGKLSALLHLEWSGGFQWNVCVSLRSEPTGFPEDSLRHRGISQTQFEDDTLSSFLVLLEPSVE